MVPPPSGSKWLCWQCSHLIKQYNGEGVYLQISKWRGQIALYYRPIGSIEHNSQELTLHLHTTINNDHTGLQKMQEVKSKTEVWETPKYWYPPTVDSNSSTMPTQHLSRVPYSKHSLTQKHETYILWYVLWTINISANVHITQFGQNYRNYGPACNTPYLPEYKTILHSTWPPIQNLQFSEKSLKRTLSTLWVIA